MCELSFIIAITGVSLAALAPLSAQAETAPGVPQVQIGLSKPLPVVREKVTVSVYVDGPVKGKTVRVLSPKGQETTLPLDANGRALWRPGRYGKHVLRFGEDTREVRVVARPLIFHWWDGASLPRYATIVMMSAETLEKQGEFWRRRGVIPVTWACGEYCGREEHGEKRLKTAEEWFDKWYGRNPDIRQFGGIAVDELYVSARPVDLNVSRALVLTRQAARKDFHIGVYLGGFDEISDEGAWNLRLSGALALEENYWGDYDLSKKRWNDVVLRRLHGRGLLSLSPGFQIPDGRHGPLNEAELREDFAKARRAAPEMPGISLFNGYSRPDLDPLADRAIEDFFLKPVIHLRPKSGKLAARNIGNEDAEGVSVAFFSEAGAEIGKVSLPLLRPGAEHLLSVPEGAVSVRLDAPSGMANLYENETFRIPESLHPLQMVSSSIKEGATLRLADGNLTFTAKFNGDPDASSLDGRNVWLKGVRSGLHPPEAIRYDASRRALEVDFGSLPEDLYTLWLLSGETSFRDKRGYSLDGSGDGFIDPEDHFAVHFILK